MSPSVAEVRERRGASQSRRVDAYRTPYLRYVKRDDHSFGRDIMQDEEVVVVARA